MSKIINVLNHTTNQYEDWTKEEILENFKFTSEPDFAYISEIAMFNDCLDFHYFHGGLISWKNTFGTYRPTQVG